MCGMGLDQEASCDRYECANTRESIEREMLNDIRDPAVCGAKEPKIAALLWVLHEDNVSVFEKVKKMFTGGE